VTLEADVSHRRPLRLPKALSFAAVVVALVLAAFGLTWLVPRVGVVGLVWTVLVLAIAATQLYNVIRST